MRRNQPHKDLEEDHSKLGRKSKSKGPDMAMTLTCAKSRGSRTWQDVVKNNTAVGDDAGEAGRARKSGDESIKKGWGVAEADGMCFQGA